jgi:hypothetical protein
MVDTKANKESNKEGNGDFTDSGRTDNIIVVELGDELSS